VVVLRDALLARAQAYSDTFDGERAAEVLDDLARFCHANSTTHVEGDSHGTSQLEGRRQVWLRIQGYRDLTEMPEMEGQADLEE
jgi:hypothetical protein